MPVEVEFAVEVDRPENVTFSGLFGGLVARWLDQGEAGEGARSDLAPRHDAPLKPYTLRSATICGPRRLIVRVVLLDDRVPGLGEPTMADDLIRGIQRMADPASEGGLLGRQQCRPVVPPVGESPLTTIDYESWEDLASRQAHATWLLAFESPTIFRNGEAYRPFPLPHLILQSLCRAWNEHAPANLRTVCAHVGDCVHSEVVRTLDDATVATKLPPSVRKANGEPVAGRNPADGRPGFRGQTLIGLRTRSDIGAIPDVVRHEVSQLLAFSRYAGVGGGTARGYGATTPRPVVPGTVFDEPGYEERALRQSGPSTRPRKRG